MIISDSSIQLTSEQKSVEQQLQMASLRFWRGRGSVDDPESSVSSAKSKDNGNHFGRLDRVSLSRKANGIQPQRSQATPLAETDKAYGDLNIQILREMIQRLTGKILEIRYPQDAAQNASSRDTGGTATESLPPADAAQNNIALQFDYYQSHYEYESTSFSAQGTITTADGRTVDFTSQLNMSREFMEEQRISAKAGQALKDPLAVNFAGTAAELTQTSFAFDIDSDGRPDQIAFTTPESGFLALDRNKDGAINDGSELFGATSGNGFQELSAFDEDGNGWIDEKDSIFNKLRIWTKDSSGEDQLFSLGEKGIGAIYLSHISTPFSVKDSTNQLLGQVRDTGMFVREDGTVGTMQQIDLAV